MRWHTKFYHRLRSLFRKKAVEEDLRQELRFHLEQQAAQNMATGMSREEALQTANREFGGVERYKEECRDERRVNIVESFAKDLRHGLRTLRKSPGFTTVCILTLALGLGANAAVFSMVGALLLHPYNFRSLDTLVRVWEDRGIDSSYDARFISPADVADLRTSTNAFEDVATYAFKSFSSGARENIQAVLGCRASANFFDVLGVTPSLGRLFSRMKTSPDRIRSPSSVTACGNASSAAILR